MMTERPDELPDDFYTSGSYQFYGLWLRGQGREAEATEIFREATVRNGSPQAYSHWGTSLLYHNHQPEAAIIAFQEAIRRAPDFASAYHKLGEALAAVGRYSEALEMYQKVLALSPKYCSAYCGIGDIYKQQGDIQAAIQAYRDAITIWPNYVEAHLALVSVLIEAKKTQEVLEVVLPLIIEYPNCAEVHLIAGEAFQVVGRVNEARLCWQRVLVIRDEFVAEELGDEELDQAAEQARQRLAATA